jgi:RimJ/RimL family protein N-acetyltransferase
MTDELELMHMHVQALYTHDARGRIIRTNYFDGGVAPRFFIGRTSKGNVVRVRDDIDDALARELETIASAEEFSHGLLEPPYGATPYETALASRAPIEHVETGPAYWVAHDLVRKPNAIRITLENRELLQRYQSAWFDDVIHCQPFVGVVYDGVVVSVCASVRITDRLHEAGVDTHPDFRGRGFAPHAVAAWARAVREANRIPSYSTSWKNTASQAVAAKLGLTRYGTTLHIK